VLLRRTTGTSRIAIEALQAGKHVFARSHVTLHWRNQLIRMRATLSRAVFFVGTQQRSDPIASCVRSTWQKGLLGKIQRVKGSGPGPSVLNSNCCISHRPVERFGFLVA